MGFHRDSALDVSYPFPPSCSPCSTPAPPTACTVLYTGASVSQLLVVSLATYIVPFFPLLPFLSLLSSPSFPFPPFLLLLSSSIHPFLSLVSYPPFCALLSYSPFID
mmetsp:Transcript_19710/g.32308  ORF Transcript_19710/g.32308 Transcript_19710/m.32308 type:complete len:107 (+) Transcript_19710:85-405(+)